MEGGAHGDSWWCLTGLCCLPPPPPVFTPLAAHKWLVVQNGTLTLTLLLKPANAYALIATAGDAPEGAPEKVADALALTAAQVQSLREVWASYSARMAQIREDRAASVQAVQGSECVIPLESVPDSTMGWVLLLLAPPAPRNVWGVHALAVLALSCHCCCPLQPSRAGRTSCGTSACWMQRGACRACSRTTL